MEVVAEDVVADALERHDRCFEMGVSAHRLVEDAQVVACGAELPVPLQRDDRVDREGPHATAPRAPSGPAREPGPGTAGPPERPSSSRGFDGAGGTGGAEPDVHARPDGEQQQQDVAGLEHHGGKRHRPVVPDQEVIEQWVVQMGEHRDRR